MINWICLGIYQAPLLSALELTKLVGLLNLTALTTLPTNMQLSYLKQSQIQTLNQIRDALR